MKTEINVFVKEPNKPGHTLSIEPILQTFQQIVGGFIDSLSLNNVDICCYLNEEGKLLGLEPNLIIVGDVLVGNLVFFRVGSGGEEMSLTDSDYAFLEDWTSRHSVCCFNHFARHKNWL
ncbi:MAG: DUF3846 domain-containing protein [Clostridia bacterium]